MSTRHGRWTEAQGLLALRVARGSAPADAPGHAHTTRAMLMLGFRHSHVRSRDGRVVRD